MPELVERAQALQTLRKLLLEAGSQGRLALVAGEAGIGKTSLLQALALGHDRVWWGGCDALQTPHPLAPLLDIARQSQPRFAALLNGPRPALFDAVLDELRQAPTPVLMVVEDVHWADDATLDLLKFIGRRIAGTRALLVISLRDDEFGAAHPLRRVLGELPAALLTRVDLPRLSPQGVALLAQHAERAATGLHEATRGNPFFVTELLREGGDNLLGSLAGNLPGNLPRSLTPSVPRSVQDLVLARLARLPAVAQDLLCLVSVMPGHVERALLDRLLTPTVAGLDACLNSGLLLTEGANFAFRHELARVAIESSLSTAVLEALHARVLSALRNLADGAGAGVVTPARLLHHAVRARDTAAVSRLAPLAAALASERGAHREAAALWHQALSEGQPADEVQLRDWLQAYAQVCAQTHSLDDALQARRRLEQMARQRADTEDVAEQLSRQAALQVSRLHQAEADALSQQALQLLQPLPPALAHARVWATEAALRMLNRDCELSLQWARKSLALAQALGDAELAINVRGTLGTALLFIDHDAGCAELQHVARCQHEHPYAAALALSNLGSGSGELMRLPAAESYLDAARVLCSANEFDHLRHYSSAWLAICVLLRGRWDEAAVLANDVLANSEVADSSRLMALLALARLRVRCGDPDAAQLLDQALTLTGRHNTLQRIAPLRAARAEAAALRDDRAAVIVEVADALPLAIVHRHPWLIGELAYWAWHAGVLSLPPADCAEPYALEITGQWRQAADCWQQLDCPYERARALARGDADAQRSALALFEQLGAHPAAAALRRQLRQAGVRGVARGARPSTREHPCGLTSAEWAVLGLLGQGLRNADIAARLRRSVRTVDHHVAGVLAKLEVGSRLEAVQRAARAGWLAPSGPDGDKA